MNAVLPTILITCLLFPANVFAADGDAVRFVGRPRVERDGDRFTIRFELARGGDVEVAIIDADGNIVRHLAAGVLNGKFDPPAPLKPGLRQALAWDGLDDYGDPIDDPAKCSVRVRAGMRVRLDRIAGGDPYAYYSKDMGQGDHAAWRITGLEVKPDGKVYVLGNANNYGPPALRQYGASGNYVRTVYPPPAGLPIEGVRGWGILEHVDGTYTPRYSDLSSPALSTTLIAGTRGRIARLIPSAPTDELLLASGGRLMRVRTDGTIPVASDSPQTLFAAPAGEPELDSTNLAGPMHVALSPDRQSYFVGGIFAPSIDLRQRRSGAKTTGFFRDGRIFRLDAVPRRPEVFFELPEKNVIGDLQARGKSPIGDSLYGEHAALQGVAVDSEGRVFVCDRQNERVIVLDRDGQILREIPVSNPDAIAIGSRSKALYVTTRFGHYHRAGELKLLRFADWRNDGAPSQILPLCRVHYYDQPTFLATAESNGETYVWVAYTALPVRVYRDGGTQLELVRDFDEASEQRCLDVQHMTVDAQTGHVYLADGFDNAFRVVDWDRPRFERLMQDENTPLRALCIAIDSRNRRLYARGDRSPVTRHVLDGEYFTPSPVIEGPEGHHLTPKLSNDWRIGLGKGDRGIAVAPDGSLATLGALGDGPDYSGYLRFFQAERSTVPWDGLLFGGFSKVRAAGVRFDLRGNLYVGLYDGVVMPPPEGIEIDSNYSAGTGRIFKFAPTGSLQSGRLFPTPPEAPAKTYDVAYGAIGPDFARTPRFGVDGFGRIAYPSSLVPRVAVIDNGGNEILAFGTYGNRDSRGGLEGDLVPMSDVPLAWPNSVDVTDDHIFVSDIVNVRLLRLKKIYAESKVIPLQ